MARPTLQQVEDQRVPFNALELPNTVTNPVDRVFHVPLADDEDSHTMQISFTCIRRQHRNLFEPWRACRPTNLEIQRALAAAARLQFHLPPPRH